MIMAPLLLAVGGKVLERSQAAAHVSHSLKGTGNIKYVLCLLHG